MTFHQNLYFWILFKYQKIQKANQKLLYEITIKYEI